MTPVAADKSLLPVYRIRPLPLASVSQFRNSFTYRFNDGVRFELPIFAWYIEGGAQKVLVDTGANAYHMKKYRNFEAMDINTFDDALQKVGLRASDIDMVIQTHLMLDHCANTHLCTKARVVVQQDELEFALAPHPILAATYIRELFMGLNFQLVKGHTEILPGIELIPVPGHSPGCQAVSINTEKGKAVISGMCTIKDNFEPPAGVREVMPVIPPGIHLDAVEAFNSALKIKGMADIIIPCHEPSLVNVDSIP
ncbi:MAG: N-acyl homoserine lactonase family protein [Dehalococcoidia bacterium]|nr:N-acyl homoserine lactonase family protein [Dehalococcoidia bacterium]